MSLFSSDYSPYYNLMGFPLTKNLWIPAAITRSVEGLNWVSSCQIRVKRISLSSSSIIAHSWPLRRSVWLRTQRLVRQFNCVSDAAGTHRFAAARVMATQSSSLCTHGKMRRGTLQRRQAGWSVGSSSSSSSSWSVSGSFGQDQEFVALHPPVIMILPISLSVADS
ncbi:unnamed protein product [Haemonchus placei]|uniref:Uncharacterized protein n=1 Tax=Haemonchus placei TaxID=6290 RepID=A0A0N4WYX0_HAEPC|nr:unnamed protein product [Haemonchus placei]